MNLDNEKLDSLLLNIINRSQYADSVMFGFFYTLYITGLIFNDLYDISRMTIHKDIVSVQPSKKRTTQERLKLKISISKPSVSFEIKSIFIINSPHTGPIQEHLTNFPLINFL